MQFYRPTSSEGVVEIKLQGPYKGIICPFFFLRFLMLNAHQNDTGKVTAGVVREREQSTKFVGELANAVATFKNTPMHIQARSDPYAFCIFVLWLVAHLPFLRYIIHCQLAVSYQLQRQVFEENFLYKSILIMQQSSAHFEEGIVKSAWSTFDESQARASISSQEIFRSFSTHPASLSPNREWIQFAARSGRPLDPETPLLLSTPATLNAKNASPATTHSESYYILTPASFLYEFISSDPTLPAGQNPAFSLFLPNCTLGRSDFACPCQGVPHRGYQGPKMA